jgi:hypothetical protein
MRSRVEVESRKHKFSGAAKHRSGGRFAAPALSFLIFL